MGILKFDMQHEDPPSRAQISIGACDFACDPVTNEQHMSSSEQLRKAAHEALDSVTITPVSPPPTTCCWHRYLSARSITS